VSIVLCQKMGCQLDRARVSSIQVESFGSWVLLSTGVAATLELMRRLEEGASIGITPDGPKGPRHVCKKGVVTLAQQAGITVQPVTYSVEERFVIPSWDRMIVPRPFSRAVVVCRK
jgi:lysophospholipid acyltransferase (LPLAT)-like uncharacterized protein